MSSTGDKVKGMANEAAGNVKQGVGKATGNEKNCAPKAWRRRGKEKPSKRSAKPRMLLKRHRQGVTRALTSNRNGHPRMAVSVSA